MEEKSVSAGAALTEVAGCLAAAGIETARLDARLLVAQVLGVAPEYLLGHPEAPLSEAAAVDLETLTARRVKREPLAHLTGRREFWSLDFLVTPDTLIPRPDSETLIEAALKDISHPTRALQILDLGTGSGCLLLALLHELPAAMGTGMDISLQAVDVAVENARSLGMSARASFVNQSWESAEGTFDVIITNPPYIPDGEIDGLEPEVAVHEPRAALAGGTDGLALFPTLAIVIRRCLTPSGRAYVEIGAGQGDRATEIFREAGLHVIGINSDLAGAPRCLIAARQADTE